MTTEFGQEIKRLREATGWGHRTLYQRAFGDGYDDMAPAVIRQLEAGKSTPSFREVVCLAHALNAPLAHLLRLSGCALPDGLALVEEPEPERRSCPKCLGQDTVSAALMEVGSKREHGLLFTCTNCGFGTQIW